MTLAGCTSGSESDEELMGRVQADDIRAFEQLYDRYAMRAFRIARSVCRDSGRAEDAVQEGFMGVWRGRNSYRPTTGSFKTWAMQIIRHRAIDFSRREGSRPPVAEQTGDEAAASASVAEQVLASSEAQALRASLQRLPEAQSEVIALAFFGEMSHSEIAQQLSLPPGTVKGRMRLGLEKLREEMQAAG